jgi:Mg-chelatase subunit ChlD
MASLAMSAVAQTSGCWFPLTVEVVGDKPSLQVVDANNLVTHLAGHTTVVNSLKLVRASQVVIVLDDSGSMQRHRASLLRLTTDLLRSIPADVKDIGLTTFSNSAKHSRGRTSALETIASMQLRTAYGRTRLLDSIEDAARYFHSDQRTLMIVITDGGDDLSRESVGDVKKFLLRSGVRVNFVLTSLDRPGTVEEAIAPETAMDIAETTGGNIIHVDFSHMDSSEHILSPDATAKLMEFYVVGINAAITEGKLKVELLDGDGKRAHDLKLHYPKKLDCRR